VFDATRRVTYKNSQNWHKEFRTYCPSTPCILVGNKIDKDQATINRKYKLSDEIGCQLFLTSAADGTNVVRVFTKL